MKSILPLLLFVLLISCKNKPVAPDNRNNDSTEIIPVNLIINSFYGELNIVVDRTNTIYYYTPKYRGSSCGNGLDLELPEYIRLYPDSLKKISIPELRNIVKHYHFSHEKPYIYIGIDSSKNNIYNSIADQLKDLPGINLARRTLTEEELTVIAYKRTGIDYFPYLISWKNPNYHLVYGARTYQLQRDSVNAMYKKTPAKLIWQKVALKNNKPQFLKGERFEEIWISKTIAEDLNIINRVGENGEGGSDEYKVFDVQQHDKFTLFKTVFENTNDSIDLKFKYINKEKMIAKWSMKKKNSRQFVALGTFAPAEN